MKSKLLRALLPMALLALSLPSFAAPCTLSTVDPSVTICTPANGATVSSPVNIVAGVTDSSPIIGMAIYVDNVLVTKQYVSEISASVSMSSGSHYVVVQAWDQAGNIPKTAINITVSSSNPPPTISFTATPTSISAGGTSTLSWSTSNATSVSIDNGIGSVATSGSTAVSPASTTTYTLTATGPGGTSTATATVSVGSSGTCSPLPTAPSINICTPTNGSTVASPVHIQAAPQSSNGVIGMAVYVDNNLAYKDTVQTVDTFITMSNGSHYVVVQFWDNSGNVPAKASVNINVSSSAPPPTVTLSANPTSISAGGSSTLTWSTTNATSVSIDNGIGAVGTSGSTSVSPSATTTYTITATGSGGTATATATVSVGSSGVTCPAGSTVPSINICMPMNGATVASPVRIVATPNSSNGVLAMAVYVDNNLAYKEYVQTLDTNITMSNGSHYVVVQFWDNSGNVPAKASVNINVSSTAGPSITFSANPLLISSGQSSTLSWSTSGASSVTIDNGIGAVPLSGTQTVSPTTTTTYILTATGSTGTSTAYATVSVTGSGGSGGVSKLNHIVFALQENRSFDNYFGMMNTYRAMNGLPQDVDAFTLNSSGVPTNSNPDYSRTGTVTVFKMISECTENLSPSWNESHYIANYSDPSSNTFLNDGFVYVAGHYARDNSLYDINGLRAMGYYDYNDLPYYYYMASQFAMSDRWFSPAPTNTNPNRHYMYAATSTGHAYPWTGAASTSPTIWDRLTAAGISWKVYVADFNSTVFYEFINAQQYGDHIFPMSYYFTDIANGTLPQVATLETSGLNEHPENNIQEGAAFMASAINALMGSQYWKDSAFILTYDEFGGLYDHVAPQLTVSPDGIAPIDLQAGDVPGDFTRTGFRVPLMVISPYAKPHYVSHTPADFTAILKLIETRFAVPSLTARDAAQMDMTEFFDFDNPAWLTPPTPPTQPQDGPCYYDHLP